MLSTVSSTPGEAVAEALGRPPWYQLYAPAQWDGVQKLVRRVEAAGCAALVLTVDQNAGRNTETQTRLSRADSRPCATCHQAAPGTVGKQSRPMFAGIDAAGYNSPSTTWELIDRLKNLTHLKVIIKGLETREDA